MVYNKMGEGDKKLIDRAMRDNKNLHDEKDKMMPVYEDITRYFAPLSNRWNFEHLGDADFGRYIFDGEAIAAMSRMADGLTGWLVSPSIDWLDIEPVKVDSRKNRRLMAYLELMKNHILEVCASSNFYDAIAQTIADGVTFGTTVVYAHTGKEIGRPVFEALPLPECFVSENRFGEIDLLHREFEMTYRQLFEEFGEERLEKLDKDIVKAGKENMEKRVRVLHAIYPRSYPGDTDDSVKIDVAKPFASVYFYCGESKSSGGYSKPTLVLREGGLDFKHFEAWRIEKQTGLVYGVSPAMKALFDTKMLNLQAKTMADVAQLAARPPMYSDMSMKGSLKIAPGGISYGVGDQVPKPIITSLNYPFGIDAMERRAKVIREHFKTDFFMSISQIQQGGRDRTATEIQAIKSESAAVLGTIVGRMQSELLDPLVNMIIKIEKEAGRMPEAPEGLDPKELLKTRFIGPLAQAQKKYLIKQNIETGLSSLGNLAGLYQDPTLLMNVDRNYAARKLLVVNGFPYEGLRDEAEVEKDQAAYAQAQAQAQAAQVAQMQADQVQKLSKPIDDTSALARMERGR